MYVTGLHHFKNIFKYNMYSTVYNVILFNLKAWKPIDFGHPLVDPTLHYAPPALERVHIGPGPPLHHPRYTTT